MKDSPAQIARTARLLARAAKSGALATNRRAKRDKGHPYVSKVGVALDGNGSPLFLLSTLAAHTQDLLADPRAALLVETPASSANPLEAPRATLSGRMVRIEREDDDRMRACYLAHHPDAAMYANFGDFAIWAMDVDKVHYVGGFGVAKWAKGSDYRTAAPNLDRVLDELSGTKKSQFSKVVVATTGRSARAWKAVCVDADGLLAEGAKGVRARVDFASPATDARGWRARFTRLGNKT
ncbi:HugZ family protein [Pseudomonadota bacterium]